MRISTGPAKLEEPRNVQRPPCPKRRLCGSPQSGHTTELGSMLVRSALVLDKLGDDRTKEAVAGLGERGYGLRSGLE